MKAAETPMSWTKKYWQVLDHLYWSPIYLGLKSIPRKHWTIDGDMVSIPKSMTNPLGPLYRRIRSGGDYFNYVRRQEEIFSHVFDLTFGILPGDVAGEILHPFVGVTAQQDYVSLGNEVRTRYGGGKYDNVTTPDAFLVAQGAILAVELKFNAKTSLDQLAKYVMLFTAEELLQGKRNELNLLYVLNRDPLTTLRQQLGVDITSIDDALFDRLCSAAKNATVQNHLRGNEAAARSVLQRLRVHGVTWASFTDRLAEFSDSLKVRAGAGDRTLKRLIDGLVEEIRAHPLANLT